VFSVFKSGPRPEVAPPPSLCLPVCLLSLLTFCLQPSVPGPHSARFSRGDKPIMPLSQLPQVEVPHTNTHTPTHTASFPTFLSPAVCTPGLLDASIPKMCGYPHASRPDILGSLSHLACTPSFASSFLLMPLSCLEEGAPCPPQPAPLYFAMFPLKPSMCGTVSR
jgi:hypothetical protein